MAEFYSIPCPSPVNGERRAPSMYENGRLLPTLRERNIRVVFDVPPESADVASAPGSSPARRPQVKFHPACETPGCPYCHPSYSQHCSDSRYSQKHSILNPSSVRKVMSATCDMDAGSLPPLIPIAELQDTSLASIVRSPPSRLICRTDLESSGLESGVCPTPLSDPVVEASSSASGPEWEPLPSVEGDVDASSDSHSECGKTSSAEDDVDSTSASYSEWEQRDSATQDTRYAYSWEGSHGRLTQRQHLPIHIHTLTSVKPHACTWVGCHKRFAKKVYLTSHILTHTGEKLRVCPWKGCNQRFVHRSTLNSHVLIHSGKKAHACTWRGCDQRFAKKSTLTTHVRTHSGEKPCACAWEGCNKRFSLNSTLIRHVRTHSGEKPYACTREDCNQRFGLKSTLTRHVLTHTCDKLYACTWKGCKQRFADKWKLASHVRTHSGEKPSYLSPTRALLPRITSPSIFAPILARNRMPDSVSGKAATRGSPTRVTSSPTFAPIL